MSINHCKVISSQKQSGFLGPPGSICSIPMMAGKLSPFVLTVSGIFLVYT